MPSARAARPSEAPRAQAKLDLLIVEDDDDLRDAILGVLREHGYEALGAREGREALDVLRRGAPRMVVLDMLMPVMNGWDFLSEMDRDAALREIPVVITTWLRHTPLPRTIVLAKPLDLPSLLRAVEQTIGPPMA